MNFKKKIYLSIIIFGIILVLLVVFLLHPLFLEIKKMSQETVSQKQVLASFAAEIENLEDFKRIYPAISSNLKKIDDLFINPELPIGFISFLEESAEQSQLIVRISPLPARRIKRTPWPFLTFQIKTTASFPGFLRFLDKIENSPYLIKIQNLTAIKVPERNLHPREEFEEFIPDKVAEVTAVIILKVFTH